MALRNCSTLPTIYFFCTFSKFLFILFINNIIIIIVINYWREEHFLRYIISKINLILPVRLFRIISNKFETSRTHFSTWLGNKNNNWIISPTILMNLRISSRSTNLLTSNNRNFLFPSCRRIEAHVSFSSSEELARDLPFNVASCATRGTRN